MAHSTNRKETFRREDYTEGDKPTGEIDPRELPSGDICMKGTEISCPQMIQLLLLQTSFRLGGCLCTHVFTFRDIDERHLLRLGAGERELREGTMKDFSKFGRVNYTLQRRLELLAEVQRLAESIGVEGVRGEIFEIFFTREYGKFWSIWILIHR